VVEGVEVLQRDTVDSTSLTTRPTSSIGPAQVCQPLHREGWIYEERIDGWRMLAYKSGDRVRPVSRNERDHTRRFRGPGGGDFEAVGALPRS
jgi:ATP-dependent DNA ligase